ncbi:unnamed protein product [Blepharisma stoltei]|uniref:Uncharacterized protein n=1 Tax=Blepharisma stoltei TaxID=1481888 RepID=A0AAU9IF88_9CILI|nr:unnamed protein product [Blepharisma stoltei]
MKIILGLLILLISSNASEQYSHDENGNRIYLEISSQTRGDFTKLKNSEKNTPTFTQLSNDGSGEDDDGMEDDTKVITVFLLNILACVLCCGFLQLVLMLSKRMNSELSDMRKNYKQYQGFLRFKEFRRAWAKENEGESSDN